MSTGSNIGNLYTLGLNPHERVLGDKESLTSKVTPIGYVLADEASAFGVTNDRYIPALS